MTADAAAMTANFPIEDIGLLPSALDGLSSPGARAAHRARRARRAVGHAATCSASPANALRVCACGLMPAQHAPNATVARACMCAAIGLVQRRVQVLHSAGATCSGPDFLSLWCSSTLGHTRCRRSRCCRRSRYIARAPIALLDLRSRACAMALTAWLALASAMPRSRSPTRAPPSRARAPPATSSAGTRRAHRGRPRAARPGRVGSRDHVAVALRGSSRATRDRRLGRHSGRVRALGPPVLGEAAASSWPGTRALARTSLRAAPHVLLDMGERAET